MAQNTQWGTPAKVGAGIVVAAVIALAAFFMGPKSPAPTAPTQTEPVQTPATQDKTPAEPAARFAPTLDVVRVTPEGSATVAGQAEAEAAVSLRIDGVEIANTPADGAGAYAGLFDLPASDKARILTVVAKGKDGVEVAGKDQVVLAPTPVALVDAAKPAETATPETATAETATTPAAITPEPAPLKITEQGVEVLQAPPAEVADNITINSITYSAGLVSVGGRGQADQMVRLYVDGSQSGEAKIAANGSWSADLSNIAPGVYTLRADQLDAAGKVTSRYETPFKREAAEALAAAEPAAAPAGETAAAPASITVTVQPGLTLWAIAEQKFGEGTMYVQVYEANKDKIKDPDLIYPGQVFAIPKSQ